MTRALLVAAALLLAHRAADACSMAAPCAKLESSTTPTADGLAAPDASIAAQHALALARSTTPASIEIVAKSLRDRVWVSRVIAAPHGARCLLPPILGALAANPTKEARAAFVSLVTSKLWAEDGADASSTDRVGALLRATGSFRPTSPEVVAMWKQLGAPSVGWASVVTQSLSENGTTEAAALFEAMLRDTAFELDNRISWLHSELLGHRENPVLLAMAIRLLDAKERELRIGAIQSVFDYNQRWWGMCGGPKSVPLATFTAEGRTQLRALAAKAKKQKLDKTLTQAITRTLAELDKLPPAK